MIVWSTWMVLSTYLLGAPPPHAILFGFVLMYAVDTALVLYVYQTPTP